MTTPNNWPERATRLRFSVFNKAARHAPSKNDELAELVGNESLEKVVAELELIGDFFEAPAAKESESLEPEDEDEPWLRFEPKRPRRTKRGRLVPATCRIDGCRTLSEHAKPYCSGHIHNLPYVREVEAMLAEVASEVAMVGKSGGDRHVDLVGLLAENLVSLVETHRGMYSRTLKDELGVPHAALSNYVIALERAGKIHVQRDKTSDGFFVLPSRPSREDWKASARPPSAGHERLSVGQCNLRPRRKRTVQTNQLSGFPDVDLAIADYQRTEGAVERIQAKIRGLDNEGLQPNDRVARLVELEGVRDLQRQKFAMAKTKLDKALGGEAAKSFYAGDVEKAFAQVRAAISAKLQEQTPRDTPERSAAAQAGYFAAATDPDLAGLGEGEPRTFDLDADGTEGLPGRDLTDEEIDAKPCVVPPGPEDFSTKAEFEKSLGAAPLNCTQCDKDFPNEAAAATHFMFGHKEQEPLPAQGIKKETRPRFDIKKDLGEENEEEDDEEDPEVVESPVKNQNSGHGRQLWIAHSEPKLGTLFPAPQGGPVAPRPRNESPKPGLSELPEPDEVRRLRLAHEAHYTALKVLSRARQERIEAKKRFDAAHAAFEKLEADAFAAASDVARVLDALCIDIDMPAGLIPEDPRS